MSNKAKLWSNHSKQKTGYFILLNFYELEIFWKILNNKNSAENVSVEYATFSFFIDDFISMQWTKMISSSIVCVGISQF